MENNRVNGIGLAPIDNYAISREAATAAYAPERQPAPEPEVKKSTGADSPAFDAQLSAVPKENGDAAEQVRTIKDKLYSGIQLSNEEVEYLQEHDDALYQKAREANQVRTELKAKLDTASTGANAQAIVQQAARQVAKGMSSAGAVTTAQENVKTNRENLAGKNEQSEQQTGSISAANPAPETQSAANKAAASTGSVSGGQMAGTVSDIVRANAAKGAASAQVPPNVATAQDGGGSTVAPNVTAPKQTSPNEIESSVGVLSAVSSGQKALIGNTLSSSVVADMTTASAGSNPTIVNQSNVSASGVMTVGAANSASVEQVAAMTAEAAAKPSIAQNSVGEVSAVPTVQEEVEAQKTAEAAKPEVAQPEKPAIKLPGTGTGDVMVAGGADKRENKAIVAQQAQREQRQQAQEAARAQEEAQRRSQERIERFQRQAEANKNEAPSREIINARTVRKTWEEFTNSENAARAGEDAAAMTAMDRRIAGQFRAYNKMNDM